MSRFDDLARYAAEIAPVIDVVHVGVHAASRPLGRELVARWDGDPGLVIDLRYVLPARPLTREGLAAVYRYDPVGEEEIAEQVGRGVLTDDGGALRATDRALAFIAELYGVHAAATAGLWAPHAARVPVLAGLAGRLLAAGERSGGPAFAQVSPPHEPEGTPAGVLLFNRLAALRLHRADAHAAAWSAAGLTARQIVTMPPGPAREAIEADTNRRAAAPYESLTAPERETLLEGLRTLM
ncbi:hypothetical protein ACFFMN_33000 [Planobispora siamensis]|uniref:Uncharacterized protein n=1 Tax=Planobispora siamensis TaxID=936338 RepID=A0A8J3SDX7_9ACTN|nr:hypothetical protein [Planobispora siamensis]GIH92617.1 hypothetical protein Psi01_32470 [Planobispora siamensis]